MRIAKVHHAALDRRDVMRVDGVPCTTPARTIIDVAAVLAREPSSELVDDMFSRRLASAPFVLHNPRRWGHDEARYGDLAAAGWHVAAIDKHDLMPGEHAWRDAFAAARARRGGAA